MAADVLKTSCAGDCDDNLLLDVAQLIIDENLATYPSEVGGVAFRHCLSSEHPEGDAARLRDGFCLKDRARAIAVRGPDDQADKGPPLLWRESATQLKRRHAHAASHRWAREEGSW